MRLLQTGDVVAGKYRLLKTLGKGGEGSVWLALHLQTERLWAVKEIPRRENGRELHELDMLKKLHHPSLAGIFDVVEAQDAVCLIMEYVRGQNLARLIKQKGRMPPEQVMEVGCELCRVLQYLHSRPSPVYHLDIKPSNLILEKGGRLVLVDFGAAKKALFQNRQEESRGTEGFAAPEQFDPDGTVDARTDIFGLGATLYFLVSGVRYSEVLSKSRVPGCPEMLGTVLKKCLRKKPEERFENSRQLERALIRLKRKQTWERKRIRFWCAVLLAGAAAGLARREISGEFFDQAQETWNYEKLLEEAYCAGAEERFPYYQKAVFLEPGRGEAYLQFVEEADADACFSLEEEETLRVLLHTIPVGKEETNEELFAKNTEEYGAFAVRLGMAYWYDYEGKEGRKIGTGWFRKAVKQREAKREDPKEGAEAATGNWAVRAEIFAHMGSYYESLGKEAGENSHAGAYWEDLRKLLEQDVMKEENQMTELRFYQEAANQILFLSEELRAAGISQKQQKETLRSIRRKTERAAKSGEEGQDTKEELVREILSRIQTAEEVLEHQQEREVDE